MKLVLYSAIYVLLVDFRPLSCPAVMFQGHRISSMKYKDNACRCMSVGTKSHTKWRSMSITVSSYSKEKHCN